MIYNSNLDRQATEIVKEIEKINFDALKPFCK